MMRLATVFNTTTTSTNTTTATAFKSSTSPIHNNDDDANNEAGETSAAVYFTIATILSLTFLLGLFFNTIAIFTFYKNKQLHTPTNSFVISLCFCDLFMCALGVPIPMVNAWLQMPVHSHALCVFDGFVVYFLGLSSMYLLAAISVDRYVMIVRPVASLVVTQRMALLGIGLCFGMGLFWTVMPLLGWNRFVPEGIGVACSISWRGLEAGSTSYIFTIFIFGLVVPLVVMMVCYVNIYLSIRKAGQHSVWGPNSHFAHNNYRLEKKMLRTIVLMISVFLISWTPYAVVSFAQTFSGQEVVGPVVETFPALIAKMSALWDPIIYIATNMQFRQAFINAVPWCVCPRLGELQSEA